MNTYIGQITSRMRRENQLRKLEYNMALANEMLENIDTATEWATKSNEAQSRNQTESYLQLLKERAKQVKEFQKVFRLIFIDNWRSFQRPDDKEYPSQYKWNA